MFTLTCSNAIISKPKNIFWIFCCIFGIEIKFGILWKKRWASNVISFWNYRVEKVSFLTCLKSHVSEHLWTVNMLKGPKTAYLCTAVFLPYFLITLKENELKISVLVVSNILRLFVNILTPDERYSLSGKASVYLNQF